MGIACCSFMLTVHCRLGEQRSSFALLVVNNKPAVSAYGPHVICISVNSKPMQHGCNHIASQGDAVQQQKRAHCVFPDIKAWSKQL